MTRASVIYRDFTFSFWVNWQRYGKLLESEVNPEFESIMSAFGPVRVLPQVLALRHTDKVALSTNTLVSRDKPGENKRQ